MTSPTVSVIITCYNLGAYIEEAVDSVLSQKFQDFEILIVDDGSTDRETRELLASYQRPGTRVIRTENRGLPAARNLGAAQTTGEYLCMLDADDRLTPQYMHRSVYALEADPSIAFVSHWCRVFGDEEYEWKPERCDFPSLLEVNTVNGAALMRRRAFEAVGGFDESMKTGCEDWDFWISMVEQGFTGRILPEILYEYRRRAGSMSRVMMLNGVHALLYRFLILKHSGSFREHLPSLLARREKDAVILLSRLAELHLEYRERIGPEWSKCRDDVVAAEKHAETNLHERKLEEEIARLLRLIEKTAQSFAAVSKEAREHQAAAENARQEIDALRRSLSWRATGPFRAVVSGILKLMEGVSHG